MTPVESVCFRWPLLALQSQLSHPADDRWTEKILPSIYLEISHHHLLNEQSLLI
jgi:hypothetical protein